MTLDDIRKVVTEERSETGGAATIATVCDAVDALLAVVDALPKCSFGNEYGYRSAASVPCSDVALRRTTLGLRGCDKHAEEFKEFCFRDFPYTNALRALATRKP